MTEVPLNQTAARVVSLYENLTPLAVARIAEIYAPQATFRDPFNAVHGVEAIQHIFERMFLHLDDCRFRVTDTVVDARGAVLIWDFEFRIRTYRPDTRQTIHGSSHLRFDTAGRVIYHRDYWDAAEELYAKLPLLGPLMRWLKRRFG